MERAKAGSNSNWTFSAPLLQACVMVVARFANEVDVVKRVKVRLLEAHEQPEFDRHLIEKHYLHDATLAGQSLRYVAELDGQWLALLSFSAAALHLKAREKLIGRSPRQRARRLALVVNNSRFLVLPERARFANLASRVLGLVLRRLSDDWQARWQHPVLVVESFVDEAQYRGTCYRASGFEAVGPTQGFGRASRDFYLEHGQPKQLHLRELRSGARRLLRRARWPRVLADCEAEVCPDHAPFAPGAGEFAAVRPMTPGLQRLESSRSIPLQMFMTSLAADPKLLTQLCHSKTRTLRQHHKPHNFFHRAHFFPWHNAKKCNPSPRPFCHLSRRFIPVAP